MQTVRLRLPADYPHSHVKALLPIITPAIGVQYSVCAQAVYSFAVESRMGRLDFEHVRVHLDD